MTTHQSVELETFTPELATQYLNDYSWDRQRHLRKGHAEFLAEQMKKGRFRDNTIRLVYWDKHWYIVNGQHTLLAIVESGCTQRLTLKKEWAVTEDELEDIYSTIDVGGRRTVADTMNAHNIRDEIGVKRLYMVNGYAAALRFINAGFFVPRDEYDQKDLMDQMKVWAPALRLYVEAVENTDISKRLMRRDVLSVGLATFHYIRNHGRVAEFWHLLATDNELRQHDPRKTLRHWLAVSQGERGGGKSGTMNEYGARMVANAWNKWWQGQPEVRQLKVLDHRAPMVILGTPYSKPGQTKLELEEE
jgi:hypothetical protein